MQIIYIYKFKVSNLAVCNGLQLDEIPPKLSDLNLMEQRLISTAHCFMTIVALPKGQTAAKGMAITFPFDVGNVVENLPRPPGNEGCVVVRVEKSRRIPHVANAQAEISAWIGYLTHYCLMLWVCQIGSSLLVLGGGQNWWQRCSSIFTGMACAYCY